MVQINEQLTAGQQNELARLYPFWFDQIPEDIPYPMLFGIDDYSLEQQVALEEMLMLKGQQIKTTHDHATEFQDRSVLSSVWIQKRFDKIRARDNFEARKRAGAVRSGSLGIVGNNLDKCQTKHLEKKTRAGLYRAQNMIQKIRLGINLSDYDIEASDSLPGKTSDVQSGSDVIHDGRNWQTLWPVPQKFDPIPLKRPIVSNTCLGCGKPLGPLVELQRNKEHGSSSVNGVQTCGSVWSCPVCRSRIISERSEELKEIYQKWKEKGGNMYMITLTVPHKKTDNLAELYGSNAQSTGLSGALGKFRASRTFAKEFKEACGYYGDLRGVEVTWGRSNGFHPHIHMLVLSEYTFDFKEWKQRFYIAWRRACRQSGLQAPSFERGVDIVWCDDVEQAQYLAKWSAATEVVSDGMKQAKHGNFSIAELERCLWDKSFRNERKIGLRKVATVLRAYYGAMKGQRMLQTGGIGPDHNWKKELLEITDTDETDTDNHTRICYLEYRAYIKIKRSGKLPDILQAAERGKTDRDRTNNVRFWLKKHGYDPSVMTDPYPPEPPPSCFSYATDPEVEEGKAYLKKLESQGFFKHHK